MKVSIYSIAFLLLSCSDFALAANVPPAEQKTINNSDMKPKEQNQNAIHGTLNEMRAGRKEFGQARNDFLQDRAQLKRTLKSANKEHLDKMIADKQNFKEKHSEKKSEIASNVQKFTEGNQQFRQQIEEIKKQYSNNPQERQKHIQEAKEKFLKSREDLKSAVKKSYEQQIGNQQEYRAAVQNQRKNLQGQRREHWQGIGAIHAKQSEKREDFKKKRAGNSDKVRALFQAAKPATKPAQPAAQR
jgi:hypothetical protein